MSFYQDSGPCDSRIWSPTYDLVDVKKYNRREAIATNIENLAQMLADWMSSYACLTAEDKALGRRISVPKRSIKDIRRLTQIPAFQRIKNTYFISSEKMDYDEALAFCYLQGMYLANPAGNSSLLTSLSEALDQNEQYWFEGVNSCSTINHDGLIRIENCEQNYKAVCQTERMGEEDLSKQCFIGETPEVSGGRVALKDIDLEKSFRVSVELDCNDETIDDVNYGTIWDIRYRDGLRFQGPSSDPAILDEDKSRFDHPNHGKAFAQIYRSSSFTFIILFDGPGARHTNHGNFGMAQGPFPYDWAGVRVMRYWLSGCPGDERTTFDFEHKFDGETGWWTDTWTIDGVPAVSSSYHPGSWTQGNNFKLGLSNGPESEAEVNVRNFCYEEL